MEVRDCIFLKLEIEQNIETQCMWKGLLCLFLNCILTLTTREMMRQIQCLLSSQDKDEACHLFTEVLDTLGE